MSVVAAARQRSREANEAERQRRVEDRKEQDKRNAKYRRDQEEWLRTEASAAFTRMTGRVTFPARWTLARDEDDDLYATMNFEGKVRIKLWKTMVRGYHRTGYGLSARIWRIGNKGDGFRFKPGEHESERLPDEKFFVNAVVSLGVE